MTINIQKAFELTDFASDLKDLLALLDKKAPLENLITGLEGADKILKEKSDILNAQKDLEKQKGILESREKAISEQERQVAETLAASTKANEDISSLRGKLEKEIADAAKEKKAALSKQEKAEAVIKKAEDREILAIEAEGKALDKQALLDKSIADYEDAVSKLTSLKV